MFLLSCVLYLCLYVILTELNKNNVRQFPHKRSPSSDDPLRPGGVGSVGVVFLREVVVRLWGVTSACRAAVEDVSMFPSPKLSDESIGSDSASLSVSLSRANETESAAENLKSIFLCRPSVVTSGDRLRKPRDCSVESEGVWFVFSQVNNNVNLFSWRNLFSTCNFFFAMRKNVWSWICFFMCDWMKTFLLTSNKMVFLQKHLFIRKKHHKQMFSSWASDIVKCCKILCHERETCFQELKTVSQTIISIHEQPTLKKNPQICLQEILLNAFSFFIPLAKPLGHKPKMWFHTQRIVSWVTSDKNLFNVQIFFFLYEQNFLAMSEKCVLKIEKCFHWQLLF